jgi:hypothetical protein
MRGRDIMEITGVAVVVVVAVAVSDRVAKRQSTSALRACVDMPGRLSKTPPNVFHWTSLIH